MAAGVKPTRIELEGWPLPDELSIDAVYSGDDADWDEAPGVGGQDQWKQPCRVATTASITIATALNAGDTIDGVTLAAGDRVLVKDQGTASQNGIYVAGTSPARAADMDEAEEVLGAAVYVIAGTANAGTAWAVTTATAVTVDSDAIDWAEFGGAGGGPDTSLVTVAATGATETVDVSAARTYDLTLDADCTITLTGAVAAEAWAVTIVLRQDATGGWTVTWPGAVTWVDGVTPVLQTDPGAVDVVTLATVDGGAQWLGVAGVSGAASPLTTKGDLWGYTAVDARVAVGTDGYVLTADSTAAAGVSWQAAASATGHYEVIVSGSAPPVAVTNEAEDDWLYGWVED